MMPEMVLIAFVAVLGACVGSFLNVVIYRLPRDESLVHPGSHCPSCSRPIAWFDNIPILSWLLLAGRCRRCKQPISIRYALVETATAMLFVAIYDAFGKSGMHMGLTDPVIDFPILAAHLFLLGGLVVISVLDIQYYLIDLRIVYVMVAASLIGWAIGWRSEQAYLWPAPGLYALCGSLGAVAGEFLRRLVLSRRTGAAPEEGDEQIVREPQFGEEPRGDQAPPPMPAWQTMLLVLYVLLGLALIVWCMVGSPARDDYTLRAWSCLGWIFFAIIIGCIPQRTSDVEIVEAIENEKPEARRQAVRELGDLMPATLGLVLMLVLPALWPGMAAAMDSLLHATVAGRQPVMGLTAALHGVVVAAFFGWAVRIFFTLVFGKEAMGVGDIYILAAVAAGAGSTVAIVGFFAGSVIGVFGVALLLLWKTSRALSYGPWIAIGALFCLLFYDRFVNYLSTSVAGLASLVQGG